MHPGISHHESVQTPPDPIRQFGAISSLVLVKLHFQSAQFELIHRVRKQSEACPAIDEFDKTADHYALLDSLGQAIFVMRVNQARRGALDCESYYPSQLLAQHRLVLCSASRFARAEQFPPSPLIARKFLRDVREDQLLDGMIGDVINANTPMVPYYERLGYRTIEGHDFCHPRLGTHSKAMLLIADGHTLTW